MFCLERVISSNSRAGVNNPSFLPHLGGNSPRNFQYAWTQPLEPLSAHPAQLSDRTARISSPRNNTWRVLDSRLLYLASLSLSAEQIWNCGRWRGISSIKRKKMRVMCAPLYELPLSRWQLDTSGRLSSPWSPSFFRHDGAESLVRFAFLHLLCAGGINQELWSGPGIKASPAGTHFIVLLITSRQVINKPHLNQELYHMFKWWNKNICE